MGDAAEDYNVVWEPQLGKDGSEGPQSKFLACDVFEALVGGAAGGGKSDVLLVDALRQAHIGTYRAILFRRETTQLGRLIDRSIEIIPKAFPGASYVGGSAGKGVMVWTFPSGARLVLTHMKEEKDKLKHDGIEYQWIGFDELTHFLRSQYIYLYSRCRTSDPRLKCYVRSSAMPWGIGVPWVKARFIDNGPHKVVTDKESGLKRVFIPATLDDNKILMGNDPMYEQRLKLMGPKLFKALRKGDWSVIEGAVFEELDYEIHGCKPHLPPPGSLIWRALDWGYAKPFSVGWYYINHDKQIVRFKEWYGQKVGEKPDVGIRMGSRDVAKGILSLEKSWGLYNQDGMCTVSHGIAGTDIWSKDDDGGDQYDNMRDEGIVWQPATTDRVQGWMECHNRLMLDEHGKPGFLVTHDCKHFWRTIPMLQPDGNKPEDVDTKMEDHIGDEWRYSLMSQPVLRNMGINDVQIGGSMVTAGQSW